MGFRTMTDDASRRPCPMCGESIAVEARKCRFCGEIVDDSPLPSQSGNDQMAWLIPLKNPQALMAYYLGLFSLIPCFPLGIAAFVLGILGLRHARRDPAVRGRVHAWIGIVLGGFFGLLWLAFTGLMIFVALVENNRVR
jgi:hypothetical protein